MAQHSASVIDSTPTWKAKFEELGIQAQAITALEASGLNTVAKFANMIGIPPGTKDADDLFVQELKQ
eukprot:3651353-Amphidinium_carterae.1